MKISMVIACVAVIAVIAVIAGGACTTEWRLPDVPAPTSRDPIAFACTTDGSLGPDAPTMYACATTAGKALAALLAEPDHVRAAWTCTAIVPMLRCDAGLDDMIVDLDDLTDDLTEP